MGEGALVKNAADPEQVRKAGKKVKTREENETLDLEAILNTPHGRRFVWKILKRCRMYSDNFSSDALVMAQNEGMRKIGLILAEDIEKVDPSAILNMGVEFSKKD